MGLKAGIQPRLNDVLLGGLKNISCPSYVQQ